MSLVCGNLFLRSSLAKQSMDRLGRSHAATAFTGNPAAST
jgi:hypothetical protein